MSSSLNREKTVEPRLLYFTIESIIDSITGNPNIKIIRQQLVSGQLRGVADTESNKGDWQISLLDPKGKRIDSLIIEDPHMHDLEVSNDKGEFETRKIQYVRTEVPFKLNYSPAVKEIEIVEITGDGKDKPLFRSILTF